MKSFVALVRKLNNACKKRKCNKECEGIGWCQECINQVMGRK